YSSTAAPQKFQPEEAYDFTLDQTLDESVLLKTFQPNLKSGRKKTAKLKVSNRNRTFGTILGSEITKRFQDTLTDDTFTVQCAGSGGQSFGAFIPKGLTLALSGDCNDYCGKGLSGGVISMRPPEEAGFPAHENIIVGNVALYGATSGRAFFNGIAGERFCVRNSGAHAVVEGVGDHGCEYMTGGRVVVLGRTGKNFAAGMSGGIAYVLDEARDFYTRVNKELVSLETVSSKQDVGELKSLLEEHVRRTGSEKGTEILANFSAYLPLFKKVLPHDYQKMQGMILHMEEKGMDTEEAQIEAFNAVKGGV
ncbi:MAG: glutamate synthase subunit alpha, partial [Clostridiales bacterium]|nr:glutamate synthase subunit alpha [Clostridiales bacterium]